MEGAELKAAPSLPSRELADRQSEWLGGARDRLLRRADIVRRRRLLDLGAGWGQVARELNRRSGGSVMALDREEAVGQARGPGIHAVRADARRLPFPPASFDLVFTQCAFLWFAPARQCLREAVRVLSERGALALVEPDFGGLMEHPRETALREVWLSALARAGADPFIGRKLSLWLAEEGFRVEARFLDRLHPAREERTDLLLELELTEDERRRVEDVREATRRGVPVMAHLPFWLIHAAR